MANPDAAGTPPRKSPLKGLFFVIGVFALAVAGVLFTTSAMNRAATLKFSQTGQEVSSAITKLEWSDNHQLFIAYKFADKDGKPVNGKDVYPFSDAKTLKVGQPLAIVYMPNSPNHSRIVRRQALMMRRLNNSQGMMVGVIAAIGLVAIALGMRKNPPEPA